MNAASILHWTIAPLHDLTPAEVFRLMRLRVDIFVVEQRCIYPELDDADEQAWHVLATDIHGQVIACARILPGDKGHDPHLGRIAVHPQHRGTGLGHELMKRCLDWLQHTRGSTRSRLSAQAHLTAFYHTHGYRDISAPYDWDGIPHVDMLREEG